jgi:hypothetical protein
MRFRFKVMHSVVKDIKAALRHDEYSYRLIRHGRESIIIYVDYVKEGGITKLSLTKNH